MTALTVADIAAINDLAAVLANILTNAVITEHSRQFGLPEYGSNKVARLASALSALKSDSRRWSTANQFLASLVLNAHQRHARGTQPLYGEDVNRIVELMRRLGWDPGDLAKRAWRKHLPSQSPSPAPSPPAHAAPSAPPPLGPRLMRHDGAWNTVVEMARSDTPAQIRGATLERILWQVCDLEGLRPEADIRVPGEQVDLAFTIGDHHFLAECKWHTAPVGVPDVAGFLTKVDTRPPGTRSIFLSMSGYVSDIDAKLQRGRTITCAGLSAEHLLAVLDGRITLTHIVRDAYRALTMRTGFVAPTVSQLLGSRPAATPEGQP